MITVLCSSLIFAIWETAGYGTPAQVVISVLLSIVTLGGSLAATMIMSQLTSIGKRTVEIEKSQNDLLQSFSGLKQNHLDMVRRVGALENARDQRDRICAEHGERIARLEGDE